VVYLPICGGLPTNMWWFTYQYVVVYLPIVGKKILCNKWY